MKRGRQGDGGGAPIRLNDELIERISNLIRVGCYVETATAQCGVNKKVYYDWLKKGHEGKKSIYIKFSNAIEKAVADAEARGVFNIDKAAQGIPTEYMMEPIEEPIIENGSMVYGSNGKPLTRVRLGDDGKPLMRIARNANGDPIVKREGVRPDWRAEAWKMERRFTKRWGQRNSLELNNPDGTLSQKTVIILPSKEDDGESNS